MVLPLVLSDLLQDGQVLLLDAVVLRLLPIHRLLLFHLIVVQVLYVLLIQTKCFTTLCCFRVKNRQIKYINCALQSSLNLLLHSSVTLKAFFSILLYSILFFSAQRLWQLPQKTGTLLEKKTITWMGQTKYIFFYNVVFLEKILTCT